VFWKPVCNGSHFSQMSWDMMSNVTCVQGGLAPIDLAVESFYHRAAPGGTGGVKTIGNYAPVSHLSSFSFRI
jgi:hypothetical protein